MSLLDRVVEKQPTDKAQREERARLDIMQMSLNAPEFQEGER